MALTPDQIKLLKDRTWRLNNLYKIVNKYGKTERFTLNTAQTRLLEEMHFLNLVLKARQMGFSTFIDILGLDCCLFNETFSVGLIADTLGNSKKLMARFAFAYANLAPVIREGNPTLTENTEEIRFANGSSINVGTSLRSGTYNFLHISEYGKICAIDPGRAAEIKSGALNTLAPGQLCFIESTAEGRSGDFYDKATEAQKLKDAGKELNPLEYKFHFFPWFEDPAYTIDFPVALTAADELYFAELTAETGYKLKDGQKWWYVAKAKEQGDAMWKEYPSTPAEAFKAVRDGAYFAKEMQNLRILKKIGSFPFVPGIAVNTFWDLGINDFNTIWLHQQVAGRNRFVGYYEASGEGLAHYFNWLDKWRSVRSATWGSHNAPHDIDHRQDSDTGQITNRMEIAKGLGWNFNRIERNPVKQNSIESARTMLPSCEFDEEGCALGVIHMESFSKEWDDKFSVWRNEPRRDDHKHGADGFMTFSDGFKEVVTFVDPWKKGQGKVYA